MGWIKLHYKSTPFKANSNFIKDLIEETFIMYNLFDATLPINILSDGGPENKGEVLIWIQNIKAPPCVKKITAKTPDFPFSNSMSESTHSIYKSEFMKNKISLYVEQHLESLQRFVDYYNNHRYFGDHFGLTNMEVLNGVIANKNRFKESMELAKLERIEKNRLFNQCQFPCVFKHV